MAWLLSFAQKARKVPLAGWLLAALVFVVIVAYHLWRKSRIATQRLLVEVNLGRVRKVRHRVMIKDDIKFMEARKAIENIRMGKERKLEAKAENIRRESANLESLAALANKTFSK